MTPKGLFEEAGDLLAEEGRLVQLPSDGRAIFVGDTHGDLDATERVASRYLKRQNRLVFLGDYVDRGKRSEENVLRLLRLKLEYPEQVYLLAGNHEGYSAKRFFPANFWSALSEEDSEAYQRLFETFPLVAFTTTGVLALHGGLPELQSLDEVKAIQWGDESWNRITWGDFGEEDAEYLEERGGRPRFGQRYFKRMMERYQKNVLVRSHQPDARPVIFGDRCVTIFTSHAYLGIRTVVVLDLDNEIRTAADLKIEEI
jgi:protein phosphatase